VKHPDGAAEMLPESLNDLRCKSYLRKHVKDLLPLVKLLTHKMNIYLGLAAGGNAMQQHRLTVCKQLFY